MFITVNHITAGVKVINMADIEIILNDILKTLTLMLDVKPTTPFVNNTSGLAFGQVKPVEGNKFPPYYPKNFGEEIDRHAEQDYIEADNVPNVGYSEDEIRDLENGTITKQQIFEYLKL